MKYIKSYKGYLINEQDGATGGSAIDLLRTAADKSTKMKDYFEANEFLSGVISQNQDALSEADGNEVIDALEPWYNAWHEAWERAEGPSSTEIEIDDTEIDDIDAKIDDIDAKIDDSKPDEYDKDIF